MAPQQGRQQHGCAAASARLRRLQAHLATADDGRLEQAPAAAAAGAAGEPYPRDMIGYGRRPPNPAWPQGAHIAVQFVINYEEGSERSILHGDPTSEF
eukprot:COSAG03_NODE_5904_length_1151_cov_1.077947_1_plen_97_part_10